MKRIITHTRLWLAPPVLAAAALLACNDDPTIATQANTAEHSIRSPDSTAGCSNPRSAHDFLLGSRHVPNC
jgi:hypothetical protein